MYGVPMGVAGGVESHSHMHTGITALPSSPPTGAAPATRFCFGGMCACACDVRSVRARVRVKVCVCVCVRVCVCGRLTCTNIKLSHRSEGWLPGANTALGVAAEPPASLLPAK